jgi:hypothetical protein
MPPIEVNSEMARAVFVENCGLKGWANPVRMYAARLVKSHVGMATA